MLSMEDVDMGSFWKPGDEVMLRGMWKGRVWWAQSLNVVEDSSERTILYCRAGYPQMRPEMRITPIELFDDNIPDLIETVWRRTNLLMINKPGEMYSVYVMWDAESGKQDCWYINIEEPYVRTEIGFDTSDLALDIVIWPDRTRWKWKDEDEFEELVRLGVFSEEKAQQIRKAGEEALQLFFDNESPFNEGWENWKLEEEWPTPSIHPDWNKL